jgi:iron complex outermembrane receptor protein
MHSPFALILSAQSNFLGKITDEKGMPLQGANVLIIERGQGTVSDAEGVFLLTNLPAGVHTILVTYVGYDDLRKKIKISGNLDSTLLFTMQERSVLLEALTVLATRAGEKSPFTFTNLSKEALQAKNLGQDVPYLLGATPSVVVTSDAGAGIGYTGIRIRGSDPTRINVTINGIPLNDAESQNVYWVDLPDFAASAEDIQIQRGVGTSTNGAGAFGASINLNTGRFQKKPYAELSATRGSFGTWKGSALFGSGLLSGNPSMNKQRTSGITLDGRLSVIQSDGYIERASVDLKSLFISTAYVGHRSAIKANIFSGHEITYQAWNGVPAQWINDEKLRKFNVSGTEKQGQPHENEVDDYTQTHAQLLFSHKLSGTWYISLAGHYTRGKGFFEQYKADQKPERYLLPADPVGNVFDVIRQRWLDNDFFGGTWALKYHQEPGKLEAIVGGAMNKYKGEHYGKIIWQENKGKFQTPHRYYYGTGDKQDFNVFSKITEQLATSLFGYLDLQYRRVTYEITGTDNDLRSIGNDVDYHFFNPKAGLLYDFSPNATAYVSFAIANREPNRDDFTDAPENARPSPERLYNTELGFRKSKPSTAWGVNFYHMSYKDQLVLTGNINDVGAAIRSNVPDSYRIGLELYGLLKLAKSWSVEANATLSRNKIKNFTEFIDNWDTWQQERIEHGTTDIAFSPNLIAFGKLNFSPPFLHSSNPLSLSVSGKHIGKQFMDNTSNPYAALNAYFVSDLQIRYVLKTSFAKEIALNLLVNNLLNARYASNAWIYRYISPSYDGRSENPYTRQESGSTYNLTGYYPQAGRNFLLGVGVRF